MLPPTMRRICWSSTTTAASATCCRAFSPARAIASPPPRPRRDARAKLDGLSFDLLILDVMMPGEIRLRLSPSRMRGDIERADPDADRARRGRKPHQGPGDRRRRLSVASRSSRANCRCASPTSSSARSRPPRRRWNRCASGRSSFISARGELRRGEEVIRLTDREREMLRVLAGTPGETVPRLALAGNGGAVSERAVDVQVNRLRRKIERDPANPLFVQTVRGIGYRLVVVAMTSLDIGIAPPARRPLRQLAPRDPQLCRRHAPADPDLGRSALAQGVMPKGLYARALLIIIVPMVILQSVVAFVFMERHWNLVTQRLSAGGGAGHRRADRRLPRLSAGRRPRADPPHRAGAARPGGRFPARCSEMPPPGPKPFFSLLDQALSEEIAQADRPAVLDRHGRPLGAGRNPHPARQHGDARVRAAQRGLRVEFGNLPALDGRHLAGAARRRHPVPAQPDQADPAAGRRRRKLRQGPRGAEFPPARRARGAARGAGLHRDEDAHRARDRAAHRHAGRRLARPAHRAHALQARTRADRRQSRKSRR